MKGLVGMVMALVLSAAAAGTSAQSTGSASPPAPSAPTLTIEQKQAIQILAQRMELAQLRAQAAQADFDKARGEIAALLQSLQKDGYDLNLQTMEYDVKKAAPTKGTAPGKGPGGSEVMK